MQVKVLVVDDEQDGAPTSMIVQPFVPETEVSRDLQNVVWHYFEITKADDKIIEKPIGSAAAAVTAHSCVLSLPILPRDQQL